MRVIEYAKEGQIIILTKEEVNKFKAFLEKEGYKEINQYDPVEYIRNDLSDYMIQTIKCPECGTIQPALVHVTMPFNSCVHHCKSCEHIITESDWEEVEDEDNMNIEHAYRLLNFHLKSCKDSTLEKISQIDINNAIETILKCTK
jgi:hypothetical protein